MDYVKLMQDYLLEQEKRLRAEEQNAKLTAALAGLVCGLDDYWITTYEGKIATQKARALLDDIRVKEQG